ncbi:acetyl-CoA synthetase-like protein [Fomitopsis serialis]|uniref:acetyl-CoA synthetase-like protein n=1 Tax=Fomitopsis serialis TaxID=139415 RepID=UPI00200849EE|nr:acetyl-CoA synthetase-like protein [Neoantrodia serialis]KAH9912112.1 acetyl-CoA synthetase-like protein [Neoantrodia serialis]
MSTSLHLLPPHPHTQGHSCATFKIPPLDGSLTFPQMFDFHEQHSADHRLFVYAGQDGAVNTVNWSRASVAIRRAAILVTECMSHKYHPAHEIPVVAILSASDAIPYATLMMGIMRAGYTPFPLSARNSAVAVAHLLAKTNVVHIFVGLHQAMQDLNAEACEILKSQYSYSTALGVSPMPVFNDFYDVGLKGNTEQDIPYDHPGLDKNIFYLHSSGSTAFPKPIPWTYRRMLQISRAVFYGERDLTGRVMALFGMPMFHAMGIMSTIFACAYGQAIAITAPTTSPTIPTIESIIHGAMATKADLIMTVPSIVEAWSHNPEWVKWLATIDGISYGGGPLNKERGDYRVSQGVRIFCNYGSTETGVISTFLPAETGMDWEYFRFGSFLNVKLDPCTNNEYEVIIVENELLRPNVVNTKVNGVDAYATSDLVAPHPTQEGLYKVVGRTDDQIMHSTGEKSAYDAALETMMNQDPHVQASAMFGRGRLQAGILIDPKPEYSFDPSDEASLVAFRNKICQADDLEDELVCPQHSRLFKEMIIVAKPDKPFSYTAKGTVRRGAVIQQYEDEIDALYDIVDAGSQSSVAPPVSWDITTATDFVRKTVAHILKRCPRDGDDLFQHGCDSLQATYIRNTLLRAVRKSAKVETRHVSQGFVYSNPSIKQLSAFISSVALGTYQSEDNTTSSADRINAMHAMVAKYTSGFSVHKADPSVKRRAGDIVLVTGTTGSLGCHLLSQLAAKKDVEQIYALNRASKDQQSLRERQQAALLSRKLDASILDSDKVVLLEGDLTKTYFGLGEKVFRELHCSVTNIIHNAWRVDFVISLSSFEPQVQGVRALIEFALSSPLPEPPRLLFESSMGTLQNAPSEETILETAATAEWSVGTGYAESKWVSEQILFTAGKNTPLTPLIARLGQICAGPDGAWNAHEWYPSMRLTRRSIAQVIDWIQSDLATAALIDFHKALSPTGLVHLVHPRPIPWHDLAVAISAEFAVPLVPFATWLAKLEEYAAAQGETTGAARLHALHLLPKFREIRLQTDKGKMTLGTADMDVSRAKEASPTLADPGLRQIGVEDVKRWVAYWRKIGLFARA